MVKYICLVLVLFLTGCGNDSLLVKEQVIKEVKVPVVADCPAPPEMHHPVLAIDNLSDEDKKDSGRVAKAYKVTVKQLQGYIAELESALDGYRK